MRVWMRFCSFVVICFLVYVHLGPVRWQPPRTGLGWQLDHFLGYFAATSIVWLAWPKRPFVVGGFLMVTAVLLEALQLFHTGSPCRFSRCAVWRIRGADTGFARCTFNPRTRRLLPPQIFASLMTTYVPAMAALFL
jgi:hypothetical protein